MKKIVKFIIVFILIGLILALYSIFSAVNDQFQFISIALTFLMFFLALVLGIIYSIMSKKIWILILTISFGILPFLPIFPYKTAICIEGGIQRPFSWGWSPCREPLKEVFENKSLVSLFVAPLFFVYD